jgi:hypothetical protein
MTIRQPSTTTRPRSRKPRPARPADENRRRRLEIIAELDRMMSEHSLDPISSAMSRFLFPPRPAGSGSRNSSLSGSGRAEDVRCST